MSTDLDHHDVDPHLTGAAIVESPTVRQELKGSPARRLAAIVVPPLLLAAICIGIWYFISYQVLSERRQFLLRPPHRVLQKGFLTWDNFKEILDGTWSSTRVAAIGLVIAIVLGVTIAVLMSQAKVIERATFPLLVALQAVPILALVPLIAMWWGTTQRSRVIVCVLISFFPIVLNTLFGLHATDHGLHDLATLHKASRWQRLRKVMFPSALPALFAGLRISAGLSVIGAIVGDFFFGRGDVGLGQLLKKYANNTNYGEQLLAGSLVAASLGIAVFLLFTGLQNAAIGKWHDSKSGSGR